MDNIKATANCKVDFSITFTLTKGEAMALEAIAGYGSDEFLKVFYEKLGKAYLQPNENAMRNLFHRIRTELPAEIEKISKAQTLIGESLIPFQSPNK
jgi:hypothetical protein